MSDVDATSEAAAAGWLASRSVHAFVASISVILVSELGDKTFFIAAIMAMRHPRWTVFSAAISALIIMTLLSVFLGMAVTVIPKTLTHFASIILFAIFGAKMLFEGYKMTEEESREEYEEVQKTLAEKETTDVEYSIGGSTSRVGPSTATEDPETGVIRAIATATFSTKIKRRLMTCFSLVFLETLTMTMLAEWGDRSQITTIILAAREDPVGVTLGAVIGHAICSAIAVIGGRMVAQMISVRTVTLIGGVIFLLFAVSALFMGEG